MLEHCRYIEHENGIHEIILLTASKEAVDCYISIVGPLFLKNPDETLRYILNANEYDNLPPLHYFIQQSNAYKKQHWYIRRGRLAVFFTRNALWLMVASVVSMLNTLYRSDLVIRVFEATERKDAIEWLLCDD